MHDMKRIFAVISLHTLVFSTGCTVMQTTTGQVENPMTEAFTAEVTITNADSEAKAELTRYGSDAWCVVFSEPQTLSGVQLDFIDDEVTASYKGLAFSVPQSAQAVRTELQDLMQIIDSMALTPNLDGKNEEGKIICEGEIDEGSYTLTFSEQGIPQEFSLPCYGLVIIFDSFTQQAAERSTETSEEVLSSETSTESIETVADAAAESILETVQETAPAPETADTGT